MMTADTLPRLPAVRFGTLAEIGILQVVAREVGAAGLAEACAHAMRAGHASKCMTRLAAELRILGESDKARLERAYAFEHARRVGATNHG